MPQWANAAQMAKMDFTMQVDDNDVHLKSRWEGRFHEDMELQDFPADTQALKMSLCINCRTKGMMPLVLPLRPTGSPIPRTLPQ